MVYVAVSGYGVLLPLPGGALAVILLCAHFVSLGCCLGHASG